MKRNVIIFFSLILLLQACSDPKLSKEQFLVSGNAYYQQHDYEKARLEYRNALQLDKNLADAYYHLGLIAEADGNLPEMFANLSQASALDATNLDAKLKVAKFILFAGMLDKAEPEINAALTLSPDNPEPIVLKGALLFKRGNQAGAMEQAELALSKNPVYKDAVVLKASVLLEQKKTTEADKLLNAALQANPDDLALNKFKLESDKKTKNSKAIEAEYLELLKHFPDNWEFAYELSKYYREQDENIKGLNVLQKVVANFPQNIQAKLVYLDFYARLEPTKLEDKIKAFISLHPDEVELYIKLSNYYLQHQNYPQAKQTLNWIIEHKPDTKPALAAKIGLAKIALQADDTTTASSLADEVLKVDNRFLDALLLKDRIELIKAQYDTVIADARNLIRDYPNSDDALVLLAQAYSHKNSPELAEENFRKALALNPANFEAVMPIVSRMIKSHDLSRAQEVLQKTLLLNPNNLAALQALAQVKLLNKDWSGTQKTADLIAVKPNGAAYALYLHGKVMQAQSAYREAVAKYRDALLIDPSLNLALDSMVECYTAMQQRPQMLSYLEQFITDNQGQAYPVLLKARLYQFDKKYPEALSLLNQGIAQWPEIPDFYQAKGLVYRVMKDSNAEIQAYKSGAERLPDDIRLRSLLASAYESVQDYDNALKNYRIITDKQPSLIAIINNEASLLLDHFPTHENNEQALRLAQQLENSQEPYYLDTYAWALLKNAKFDKSLTVFEKVIKLAPGVPGFKYHAALAYQKVNNNAKAIAMLENALQLSKTGRNFMDKAAAEEMLLQLKSVTKPQPV